MCGAAWELSQCQVRSVGGVALLALSGAEVALEACCLGGASGERGGPARGASDGLVAMKDSTASLQVREEASNPRPGTRVMR
jgi:hypothetical protein